MEASSLGWKSTGRVRPMARRGRSRGKWKDRSTAPQLGCQEGAQKKKELKQQLPGGTGTSRVMLITRPDVQVELPLAQLITRVTYVC